MMPPDQNQTVQTKTKKVTIKKKIKGWSNDKRAPSREFNNPIYADLDQDLKQSYLGITHNQWGPWAPKEFVDLKTQQNTPSTQKKIHRPIQMTSKKSPPIMQIAQPQKNFNETISGFLYDHKIKKRLPEIPENNKIIIASIQPTPTPPLQELRYKSLELQRRGSSEKVANSRTSFKIRTHPLRQNFHEEAEKNYGSLKNLKSLRMGKFVFNRGLDQYNDDHCLLNYYQKHSNSENRSEKQHKESNIKQQRTLRQNIVNRLYKKKIPFAQS